MSVLITLPILMGFLAGLVVNYFADVLPIAMRLSGPICVQPGCHQPISWKDYLLLKRGNTCGHPRNIRTYVVFPLCLITSLYVWFSAPARLGYAPSFIFLIYLYVVAIIDLEHRLILLPLSIAGLILAICTGWLMHGWLSTLIGGVAGFAIMYLFYLLGKLFTRFRARRLGQDPEHIEESLGSGDVTLASILGLFLGWPLIWFGLFLGVLLGGLVGLVIVLIAMLVQRKNKEQAMMTFFPLGPAYILSATLLVYLPNLISFVLPK